MQRWWVVLALIGWQCRGAPQSPPEFVKAGAGEDVAAVVRAAMSQATAEKRRLLVYVSASWCEPCQRFQRAVEGGELHRELSGIRFLKFDRDHDEERLARAGYQSVYIPLFVVPDARGRASAVRMEGSVKGAGAVKENIVPRLQTLLSQGN